MVKKAQGGIEAALEAKTAERNTKGPEFRPGQVKRMTRVFNANPERGVRVAKRMLKRANAKAEPIMKKGGKIIKKAQNGNILKSIGEAAGKVIGKAVNPRAKDTSRKMGSDLLPKMKKKAKNGTSFGMLSVKAGVDNNPNPTAADRIAGAKKKAKFGKKMQYGGEAASMVPMMKKGGMKKKYKNGGTLAAPTKGGVSMQLGTYTRQIGKNYTGKNVVNKGAKAKMGKSVGKCKNGC